MDKHNSITTNSIEGLSSRINDLQESLAVTKEVIKIKDTPPIPLAFNVEMPENFGIQYANLNFSFHDFELNGIHQFSVDPEQWIVTKNQVQLTLEFSQLHLEGRYRITGKETLPCDIDSGGNLLPLDLRKRMPEAAGADPVPTFDPATQDVYLKNARAQRETLKQKKNGPELMAIYDKHNETYNNAFVNSRSLRKAWKADGATAEMATHTHEATQPDATIQVNPDPDKKRFGKGNVSYNANAFTQQTNLAFTLYLQAQKAAGQSDYTKTKEFQAAKAASGFRKAVGTQTNNDKKSINSLHQNEVLTHVEASSLTSEQVIPNDDEFINQMKQGTGDGGAVAIALERNWYVLDEEEKASTRELYEADLWEQQYEALLEEFLFLEGKCQAEIPRTNVVLDIALTEGGELQEVINCRIQMPVYDLLLDDEHWTGTHAELLRERVGKIYFVRSLLQNQIIEQFKSLISGQVQAMLA